MAPRGPRTWLALSALVAWSRGISAGMPELVKQLRALETPPPLPPLQLPTKDLPLSLEKAADQLEAAAAAQQGAVQQALSAKGRAEADAMAAAAAATTRSIAANAANSAAASAIAANANKGLADRGPLVQEAANALLIGSSSGSGSEAKPAKPAPTLPPVDMAAGLTYLTGFVFLGATLWVLFKAYKKSISFSGDAGQSHKDYLPVSGTEQDGLLNAEMASRGDGGSSSDEGREARPREPSQPPLSPLRGLGEALKAKLGERRDFLFGIPFIRVYAHAWNWGFYTGAKHTARNFSRSSTVDFEDRDARRALYRNNDSDGDEEEAKGLLSCDEDGDEQPFEVSYAEPGRSPPASKAPIRSSSRSPEPSDSRHRSSGSAARRGRGCGGGQPRGRPPRNSEKPSRAQGPSVDPLDDIDDDDDEEDDDADVDQAGLAALMKLRPCHNDSVGDDGDEVDEEYTRPLVGSERASFLSR